MGAPAWQRGKIETKEKIMDHIFNIRRFADAPEYTYSYMIKEGEKYPRSFICEDEYRSVKVAGETRIPEGRYRLRLRKVESGLTLAYRKRYPWFTWHIELIDVPGFNYVYIHVGNSAKDTDACLLMADTCDLSPPNKDGFVGESVPAFKRFYEEVTPILENDEERVFVDIRSVV